jgi:hypothetical protein
MRKINFTFQLQLSLLVEARKVAEAEGVTLSQLINAYTSSPWISPLAFKN